MTGRTVLAAGAAVLVVVLAMVAGLAAALSGSGSPGTATAAADIPASMLALYQRAAATCPGLDWAVLAAVGKIETDHARSPLPGVTSGENYAGAAVISGSALTPRYVRLVGSMPRAGEVSAGCES